MPGTSGVTTEMTSATVADVDVPSGRADAASRPAAGAPVATRYRPRHPLDLRATLAPLGRGPGDPTTSWDATGLWRAFRTPGGPATLRLEQRGDEVDARAWGPGAAHAIAAVPALLGAQDTADPLDDRGHPVLRRSLHRNPGLRLGRTGRILESLLPAIIEQRVTSTEAFRAWAALVRRHGEPAPGPHTPERMRVVPAPQAWRAIPSWQWHRAGVDPRRSRVALEAVRRAAALERLPAGGAEARRALQSIPGIGVWTAAEAVQRSHGDPDAVSVGDYNLCGFVGHALVGHAVDDAGMLELLEPWAGQRHRVVRMLLASGLRVERHGPRATIQDHRRH